ncbi:MAG: hypothetical protein GC146_03330 [Limimaricola sp.]|uniref:hypothetical protein n=1 Tax=Limimaricola sp. TaxID=2211665 RepID=UPI001D1FA9A3|nr:hypothetical protein [Limimaricola sp.]MBI1416232.1 hypothetical protein [Limimaricola sp.]
MPFPIFFRFRGRTRHHTAHLSPVDGTRSRRDFVHDMLTRNAEAFSSDLDIQQVMLCFPDRF